DLGLAGAVRGAADERHGAVRDDLLAPHEVEADGVGARADAVEHEPDRELVEHPHHAPVGELGVHPDGQDAERVDQLARAQPVLVEPARVRPFHPGVVDGEVGDADRVAVAVGQAERQLLAHGSTTVAVPVTAGSPPSTSSATSQSASRTPSSSRTAVTVPRTRTRSPANTGPRKRTRSLRSRSGPPAQAVTAFMT